MSSKILTEVGGAAAVGGTKVPPYDRQSGGTEVPPYDRQSGGTEVPRYEGRETAGLAPWQFFLLLSMLGATAAVIVARDTHPAALLLLSAAVISAGFVAIGLYHAFSALLGKGGRVVPPSGRTRALLEADKALVLRSIKELEFDRAMGKVSEADFAEIDTRLRARALGLMQQLESTAARAEPVPLAAAPPAVRPAPAATPTCTSCGTLNDTDARFCKRCGTSMGQVHA
jgi:hypothetical protein